MITNLSIYSEWKKSTLNRMTDRFSNELMRLYRMHLHSIMPHILEAIDRGDKELHLKPSDLTLKIHKVLLRHQSAVVKVAVSDGIREITPDKKLSTWENYPIHLPVEETFINLAERKTRDTIFNKIDKIISRKNKSTVAKAAMTQKEKYLESIKNVFRTLAEDLYEQGTDSPDRTKIFIQSWFEKSKAQTETIFRTETTRYFNDARINYFQNETEIDFMQVMAITDGRISKICECRDGYVIPAHKASEPGFRPPYHPNCRTILSPLDTDLKSDQAEVKKNLGAEFGVVHSETSNQDFKGTRARPVVALPKGWA